MPSTAVCRRRRQIIVMVILLVFAPQSSQSRPPETNEPDQCPDTLKPDGINPYKMRGVLTPAGDEIMCCGLNPGFYYKGPCNPDFPSTTQYLPCPTGTFMDEKVHIEHRCKPHSNCPIHYGVKGPGNSTDDTECEKCRPGFDSLTNSRTETCTEIFQPRLHTLTKNVNNKIITKPTTETITASAPANYDDSSSHKYSTTFVIFLALGISALWILVFCLFYVCCLKPKAKSNGKLSVMWQSRSDFDSSNWTPINGSEQELSRLRLIAQPSGGPDHVVADVQTANVVVIDEGRQQRSAPSTSEIGVQTEVMSNCTEREKKLYDLGYEWAEMIDKNDICPLFRKLTILGNPETEINNTDKPESPREQFIRLFQVLVKHGEDHVNPQRIADVCIEKRWTSYAHLVQRHFPDEVQLPTASSIP
ncbi:unnamed protein product [Clavelina lepadiformis]|uniref:TNFR-Cys domain-containing protein n=1 Tax=Clavelina lepadiformis TaxID=159417 RepID=A0ABP0FJA1_CLALP